MSDHEEEKPFVVRDRRRFTQEGEEREAPESPPEPPPPGAARAAQDAILGGPKGPDPEQEPSPVGERPPEPRIDFTTFAFSLGSSALMHLGEAPNPETGQLMEPNLQLAKETIDLLAMLEEKTKGNLSQEEARFLSALLYDLRLRYIEAAKR